MATTRSDMLHEYSLGYDQLKEALSKYPKEMWQYKPAPDQWSIHEIVIHVADSEAMGYGRMRMIVAENGEKITAYDQDKWANELRYHDTDVDMALELFGMLRKVNTKFLEETPEIFWSTHAVMHPERGAFTLDDWLKLYAAHISGHIQQMQRTYEHWLENA